MVIIGKLNTQIASYKTLYLLALCQVNDNEIFFQKHNYSIGFLKFCKQGIKYKRHGVLLSAILSKQAIFMFFKLSQYIRSFEL